VRLNNNGRVWICSFFFYRYLLIGFQYCAPTRCETGRYISLDNSWFHRGALSCM